LPLRAVVHKERYQEFNEQEIAEIYKAREEESQQFVTENAVENLAQVFTKKRYPGENNRAFSEALLRVVRKQGF
jgi:predicted ArsR family transcriptional regulator